MDAPNEKSFRATSFVIHATRGLLRDGPTRRWTMLGALVVALALLVSGSTFLQPLLNPRDHPGRFILFWGGCAWMTVLALLLAAFDLLVTRAKARAARRALDDEFRNRDVAK